MSRNGELMLKRVVIVYNQTEGVGHSMRQALAREVPLFKAKYPSVTIDIRPRDEGSPYIAGIYKDGSNRVFNTNFFGAGAIGVKLHRLVQQANEIDEGFGPKHLHRERSSVQGNWTPWLWTAERDEERVARPKWDRKLTDAEWDHYVDAYGKEMLGFERAVSERIAASEAVHRENTRTVQRRWQEHVKPYLQTDVEENLKALKLAAVKRGDAGAPVRLGEYKLFEVPQPETAGDDIVRGLRAKEMRREVDWWKQRQQQLKPPM
uniref:Large ribosomal subunit protein mL43 n=1 Tax=Neobodo designis TaxID=312471 RepID=A0A7S1QP37_NEODS|mmetsp:Transcript_49618/g.153239  ORF Transcript_49618/g.153239 Transcript_49618/m.153239 type:complete len:263 (+) Transcript_49618:96-884(+)|eukprot:CAMPEP_0174851474 /NCGR_PEP_ID=MMETSP1114-20130205/23211_1 /TAXON_ID=312471 /ORGANISM="Neobodo designis, Strain CCAP 1951/1" /LENGTH=262 /DNA_ID=CAMNT_0016086013 /DNA_START=96 /DNA_END=884 /DNA_ORIENTATION=+